MVPKTQTAKGRLEFWKTAQGVLFVAFIVTGLMRFPYQGIAVLVMWTAFFVAFLIYMNTRCFSCHRHIVPNTGKALRIPDRCPHCDVDLSAPPNG